jgi:hypothetical protein
MVVQRRCLHSTFAERPPQPKRFLDPAACPGHRHLCPEFCQVTSSLPTGPFLGTSDPIWVQVFSPKVQRKATTDLPNHTGLVYAPAVHCSNRLLRMHTAR